jgi:serine protease AprX
MNDGNSLAARPAFRGSRPMSQRVPVIVCALLAVASVARAGDRSADGKLDAALWSRAYASDVPQAQRNPDFAHLRTLPHPLSTSRVILRTVDGEPATRFIEAVNGIPGRYFPWLGAQVAIVPDVALDWLASQPDVAAISLDRAVYGTMERTAATIGARWVAQQLGVTGSGVGVATIDSGVNPWHEDLEGRVLHFADFVNAQSMPYDDYGHGTHVAGIIAGNGHDSGGARRGVAPGSHLIVLKALDTTGNGFTSNVIAAIDYAIANRAAFNIRVLNLSVAAGVYESYMNDPLTLAAKRAVDAGIVVVAAAGNRGRGTAGRVQYGGIASPGNAPWVLTVGAANDSGTADRRDDVVAGFSSRGPSPIDGVAKPDLVAPGVGIESTSDPSSALYAANPFSRIWGTMKTVSEPYLSLTGTSMASPVVAGTVALMLQANPTLTPNAVKAILEYTAESRDGYDNLTQGAGFLNARGAVELARAFAGVKPAAGTADPIRWSRHIIWGNHRVGGGLLSARANAWQPGVTWGDLRTPAGDTIGWGVACSESDSRCGDTPWTAPCDVMTQACDADSVAAASTTTDDNVVDEVEEGRRSYWILEVGG